MPIAATRMGSIIRLPSNPPGLAMLSAAAADCCECDRGDNRAYIALEQVCAHSRDIAHIVAHIVREQSPDCVVVLWYALLYFADEVRANVRRLRVDAAADPCEQRDGRCSEAEARNHAYVLEYQIEDGHAKKADAHNRYAHHRAAIEGDAQRRVQALLRLDRCARIGANRDAHAM